MEALKLTSLDPFKYHNYALPWKAKGRRQEGTHTSGDSRRFPSGPKTPYQDIGHQVTSWCFSFLTWSDLLGTESLIQNIRNPIPALPSTCSTSVGGAQSQLTVIHLLRYPTWNFWVVLDFSFLHTPYPIHQEICGLSLRTISRTNHFLPLRSQPPPCVACKMQVSQLVSRFSPGPLHCILQRMLWKQKSEQISLLFKTLQRLPLRLE